MRPPLNQLCRRILVGRDRWFAMPKRDRNRLHKTHARHEANGLCQACAARVEKASIAYTGGRWRDGLILRPVVVHPPERKTTKREAA